MCRAAAPFVLPGCTHFAFVFNHLAAEKTRRRSSDQALKAQLLLPSIRNRIMRTGISLTPLFARYLHVAQYGLAALAAFLVATVAPSARGEVVVNAIEAGGDVVIFGEGSLNLGAWTPPAEIDGDFGRVSPSSGDVVVGPITGPTSVLRYTDPVNLMGPDSFGTGGSTFADFGRVLVSSASSSHSWSPQRPMAS
jgi:hypothetical protein